MNGNDADDNGWTKIHHSAKIGSCEEIKVLADMGMNIHLKTNDGESCLHIAAANGYLTLCKVLTNEYNVDVGMTDKEGWTALHHSAKNGNYELIEFFIKKETNVNLKTKFGKNCLHIAAANGQSDLCETLITNHKFDINMTDNGGWTALHFSAQSGSYELVKFFTDKGTNIHLKAKDRLTCLHIAAAHGHLNLCKTLTNKHNFNVNVTDNYGWTPLHRSAQNGCYDLVKFFADNGTEILLKTREGINCLHIAAVKAHFNLCKVLMEKHEFNGYIADNYGWTALHRSAQMGNYELVKYFADNGTDIFLKTKQGGNCLHIAALSGHLNLCRKLIDIHEFDVNMADNAGWIALHHSTGNGSYELIKYFIDKGADIHLKTNDGKNCLHIAANKGHVNLCKKLISEHKLDVKTTDNDGWAALNFAAFNDSYELVKLFVDNGADIHLKIKDEVNCLHIAASKGHFNLCKKLIEKQKFNVNMVDIFGYNAIHYSVKSGSTELVKLFIGNRTNIFFAAKDGKNFLHLAALYGHLNLCRMLVTDYKFDVHITDNKGWAALHFAAQNGSCELIKYFIEKGADPLFKTKGGQNCLHIAAGNGNFELCKTLINEINSDVDIADDNGRTALHCSAHSGNHELFRFFADKGTDIFLKTKDGLNCLHIASVSGNLNLCKTLITKYKFDVYNTDNRGWAAVHYAAQNGNYELVNFFADKGTDVLLKTKQGVNCFHISLFSSHGHLNLCKKLKQKIKFDVDMTDNSGLKPLHYSAQNGSYELVKFFADKETDVLLGTDDGKNCLHIAALNGHLDLCKVLINKHNFNMHATDNRGWAALHFSAQNGNYEKLTFFANKKNDKENDIYLKTKDGVNCLHIAAANGHFSLCKMLIDEHNFDVRVCDGDEWSPLHHSVITGNYELIKYFIDKGSDIYLKVNDGTNCLHIAAANGHLNLSRTLLDKYNFDINLANNDGWTALHFSARNGNFALFSYLLDKGSDMYRKTKSMYNVLHLSAYNGHFDICEFVLKYFTKDYEENNSRNQHTLHGRYYASEVFYKYSTIFFHAMDVDGNTYLHLAADRNQSNVCELLLKYDTDLTTLYNKNDEAARDIAKKNNYEDVLRSLKAHYDKTGILFVLRIKIFDCVT